LHRNRNEEGKKTLQRERRKKDDESWVPESTMTKKEVPSDWIQRRDDLNCTGSEIPERTLD
jgi:hypothetical protein